MFACARCLESTALRGIVACFIVALPTAAFAAEPRAEEAAEVTNEPARPAPLAPLEPTPLPVSRHVDIGAAVALVEHVTDGQTGSSAGMARYPVAVGVGLSARVDVFRYLRANFYALRASTSADLQAGALGLSGDPGLVPITSYSFGLRLSPTLPLGPRARTWLSFGAGWGRVETGRFDVASAGGSFRVRERAFSFVEFPVAIGTSFDIIKNWLAVEFEVTGAFHAAERGRALENGQAIDTLGHRITVGPFPPMTATFVQTLGLALVL